MISHRVGKQHGENLDKNGPSVLTGGWRSVHDRDGNRVAFPPRVGLAGRSLREVRLLETQATGGVWGRFPKFFWKYR
jgi:hypothetical protein